MEEQVPQAVVAPEGQSHPFVLKAARSVAEIMTNVNYVADISVILEVLGYTKEETRRNGLDDIYELAKKIYEIIDIFETPAQRASQEIGFVPAEVPSVRRRLVEGFALSFGWLGSLLLLFMTGVSLWLALGLQSKVITLFLTGLFLGILLTEGSVQTFHKLFPFYYLQDNISETRRTLRRHYALISINVLLAVAILYGLKVIANLPLNLFVISVVSAVTISMHRAVFAVIYSLKKVGILIGAYILAFGTLLVLYYGLGDYFPDPTTRYLVSLSSAVVVLSASALRDNYKVHKGTSNTSGEGRDNIPHFFKALTFNPKTIRSRFRIQFWETLPNYLYGTFLFAMMFGDRVISWIFNPIKSANGIALPFVFNSTYHAGADAALMILFPVLIIQYVIMTPIFVQAANMAMTSKITEVDGIGRFLHGRYKMLLVVSVVSAMVGAIALNYLFPQIGSSLVRSPVSLRILRVASVADVLMAIFFANGVFIMLMNRTKWLAGLTLVGAVMVIFGGAYLAESGFENAVFAYLTAAAIVSSCSTLYVLRNLNNIASTLFARFA